MEQNLSTRTMLVPQLTLLLILTVCAGCPPTDDGSTASSSSEPVSGNGSPRAVMDTRDTYRATPYQKALPEGLPLKEFYVPKSNPLTVEKIALGRKLFFDPLLSGDESMSCATCHDPEKGWSNGLPFADGIHGRPGRRNVPTIVNAALYRSLFWDGRAGNLEGQALEPIFNPDEMAMPNRGELLRRLDADSEYMRLFGEAFPDGITLENVARALASYQRTIVVGDTPYDRYVSGDREAMSPAAIRGMELFLDRRKSKCVICHEPPGFTALFYHNLGIGLDQPQPDLGRFEITGIDSNRGAFKVPALRNVKHTAPYMHDGSLATLAEVIDLYDEGGRPNRHLSKDMRGKLNLTPQQKSDLLAFLVEGLTSDDVPDP